MVQKVQSIRSSIKGQRSTPGTREPGELYTNWPDKQLGVIDASKNSMDLIAVRFFSTLTDYAAGDFVVNAGFGYKAKVPITAGAFNATQWDTIATATSAEPPIAAGTTSQYWRGDKSWQTLDKAAVGLANVDNTTDANKPVSSATQAQLNLKAPLASPTFSGTVIAPTPAPGTNNTTVATTAFVAASYAPIMSPSLQGTPTAPTPVTSDNDTSIATTEYVKANLVTYAPLASPAFSGNPTAPTAGLGDSDTSIATTAFVQTAIGNRPIDAPNDTNAYGRKALGWVDVTEEAPADGVSYGRKNGSWVASVGGAVISDTPPPGPLTPGQLWWESDSGNTFLWFDDGTSQQWIQQNIQPAIVTDPNAGQTAETRNRIVNGAMQISQEWGDTMLTTGGFNADQWTTFRNTTGTMQGQRVQVPTPNGSVNRIRATVTGADTSLAANETMFIMQPIEGNRVADFCYGSASARQSILRFGWKSPAGTYAVSFGNDAGDRSYVALFTITAGQANTDTTQTLIVPGDTAGTWETGTNGGIWLIFSLAGGSDDLGVVGWQAGYAVNTAACSNGMATVGNVFELFDVGLYLDPLNTGIAPRWQMPDEAEELRACQRYFQVMGVNAVFPATAASQQLQVPVPYAARMRVAPAMSAVTADPNTSSGVQNMSITTMQQITAYSAAFLIQSGAAGNCYVIGHYTNASARM